MKRIWIVLIVTFCGTFSSLADDLARDTDKYSDAPGAAIKQLNESLTPIGPDYRGTNQYYKDDVIGNFLKLMASNEKAQAAALVPAVCDQWRRMPPNSSLTGKFAVGPVEINLDKLCDVKR